MLLQENLTIKSVEEILRFETPATGYYQALTQAFRARVRHKFDLLLDKICQHSVTIPGQIQEKMELLTSSEIEEWLLSPELLGLILHHSNDHLPQIAPFVLQTLEAEIARNHKKFDTNQYQNLWTNNGDYFIYFDAQKQVFQDYEAPKFAPTITFDFLSPACLQVNNKTLDDDTHLIQNYAFDQAGNLYEQIQQALEPIDDRVATLIEQMTKMIIVKRQTTKEEVATKFWSATHSHFIGKILLVNTEEGSDEDIIDGLVHEAIHSLLYIIEELHPWMPAEKVSEAIGNEICSPWTNNLLPLRAFLHALFVWYGLFNLWRFALENQLYRAEDAQQRMEKIKQGYAQVNIRRDIIEKFEVDLQAELVTTIDRMQAYILDF